MDATHLIWQDRTLVLTGAAGGLGRACLKRWQSKPFKRLYAIVRTEASGRQLMDDLHLNSDPRIQVWVEDALHVEHGLYHINSTSPQGHLEDPFPFDEVGLLVNNAGLGEEFTHPSYSVLDMEEEQLYRHVQVNEEYPRLWIKRVLPSMAQCGFGRIVQVSSALSSLSQYVGENAVPAYRLSKMLLNGLTVLAAHEFKQPDIRINSLCPGWCQTAMGGPDAPLTSEDGARAIEQILEIPKGGWHGQLIINGHPSMF